MPLPLVPIAGLVISYGSVAYLAYSAARSVEKGRRDQTAEDAMDHCDEGLTLRCEPGQANGTARLKRVIRLGEDGPGVELDLTALTRIRIRRL